MPALDLVLMEELIQGGAYRPLDQVMLAAHAVIEFGTDEQKHQLLPRIRSGEHIWCQLFSEPDAGSDLASLRTRAEADGDSWVVTGQKIWCSDAQWADMGMLLARTDPTVDRHAGLTAFVVPMDLPGVQVRPIREMTGHAEFCEVFLDDVRLGPEHVLGVVGGGWKVITSGLASERAFVGANAVQLERLFQDLVALAATARLPDGTAAISHDDVQAQLAGNLLARYCVLLDQDDVAAWLQLFTPDASYHVYGRTFTGHDGLRTMLSGAPGGLHLGGPPAIEPVDADHVRTQQNLLFVDRTNGGSRGALYDDELVRTADGWRIGARRCRFITADGLRDRP